MLILRYLFTIFLILTLQASDTSGSQDKLGLFVHQIVVHPSNSQIIYAATDNQGLHKSRDGGKTWDLMNQGIKSFLQYQLIMHPKNSETLYVSSWGGGIYKTTDGASSWLEQNDGLDNTAIWTMVFHPRDPDTLYAATSSGVLRGKQGGKTWVPMNEGLPFDEEEFPQGLVILPEKKITLVLATNQGIYERKEKDSKWIKVSGDRYTNITALAYDPQGRALYFSSAGEGIYKRDEKEETWHLWEKLENTAVRKIVAHPFRLNTLYLLTQNRGILKKAKGDSTWIELNQGINDTWVNTLTFDPQNDEIMYAGTHSHGIFKSSDGGKTWVSLIDFQIQRSKERNDSLLPRGDMNPQSKAPAVPSSFKKCNGCHGWTDAVLNSHPSTYWRMAANRRDWTSAVNRMKRRAQLLPDEEKEILEFLNTYYGVSQ